MKTRITYWFGELTGANRRKANRARTVSLLEAQALMLKDIEERLIVHIETTHRMIEKLSEPPVIHVQTPPLNLHCLAHDLTTEESPLSDEY